MTRVAILSSLVMGDDAQSLLAKLQANPDDAELRRRTAEALDDAGTDALAVLARFVNLTGHDDDTGLPCLCRKCLPTAAATAESTGMQFVRTFAVHGTRVLHFWMLAEQKGDRAHVRASVADAMAARQAALAEARK
jgi:hypothetical protein